MRKIIITSDKFTGEAALVYTAAGHLQQIDVTNTDLRAETLRHFKAAVPVHIDGLATAFSAGTTIVERDFEITFEMYWQAYNHKINKKRCELLWAKLSMPQRIAAWQGVDAYDRYLKANEWRKKADPEKYLKDQYWENQWK